MKNAIITGTMAATILIAGCGKKSPSSSATPPPTQADATSSSPVAQPPERVIVTSAQGIVLAEFKLDGTTLTEALLQLSDAAKQDDPSKAINFMITEPGKAAANPKVTLALKNVTVKEAAERIAKEAGVSVTARDYAFVFDAKADKPFDPSNVTTTASGEQLFTRSYKISGDAFVQNLKQLAPPKPGESNQDLLTRFFKNKHIEIQKPAAVFLDEKKDRLIVRMTKADQDKIEILIQEIGNTL